MWNFTNDQEQSNTVPAGAYNIIVAKAEDAKTKAGSDCLKMQFKITDGDQRGRVVFMQYNLGGSEKAVQISRGQLKSLLKASGHKLDISGSHEFVGLEACASVKVQPAKDGYEERNAISSFKAKAPEEETKGSPF